MIERPPQPDKAQEQQEQPTEENDIPPAPNTEGLLKQGEPQGPTEHSPVEKHFSVRVARLFPADTGSLDEGPGSCAASWLKSSDRRLVNRRSARTG